MKAFLRIFDNPILIKHARSRLRPQQLATALTMVLVLCLIITFAGFQLNQFSSGLAFGFFLTLQTIVLAFMGAGQVTASVGGARESGILDFHRVTPMSPLEVTLGFFFGAPVREYVMFLATLPFALICVAQQSPTVSGFLQLELILLLSSWILHAFSLFNALVVRRPRNSRGMIGLVVFVMFVGSSLVTSFTGAVAFTAVAPRFTFYGVSLPWLVVVLIDMVPLMYFLMIAACRKMDTERAHALSKPQALSCLVAFSVILMGTIWHVTGARYESLIVLYATLALALLLTITITPNLGEYIKGVRRAEKLGRRHALPWDDLALNRLTLVGLCAIVLIVPTISWYALENQNLPANAVPTQYGLTIAIAVLVLAYFGLAMQYFKLRFPRRGMAFLGLFLFLTWVVPVILGVIVGSSSGGGGGSDAVYAAIISSSPLIGIAMSTDLSSEIVRSNSELMTIQAAALLPALTFTLLFNNLVTAARRRAEAEIHTPDPLAKGPSANPLA